MEMKCSHLKEAKWNSEKGKRGDRRRRAERGREKERAAGRLYVYGVVGSAWCCVLSGLHRWCCETDSAGTARHAALLCAMGTPALPA